MPPKIIDDAVFTTEPVTGTNTFSFSAFGNNNAQNDDKGPRLTPTSKGGGFPIFHFGSNNNSVSSSSSSSSSSITDPMSLSGFPSNNIPSPSSGGGGLRPRLRTVGACAKIVRHRVGRRPGTPLPLYYDVLATTERMDPAYDRGHLIALNLGGPNDEHNIVPISSFSNRRGDWESIERQIDGYCMDNLVRYMQVRVVYPDGKGVPTGFIVRASPQQLGLPDAGNAPNLGEAQPRYDQTLGTYTWKVSNAMLPRAALTITKEVQNYLLLFKEYEVPFEAYLQREGKTRNGEAPYHFLSFINDTEKLHPIGTPGVPARFSGAQRLMILAYNGYLNSKVSDDLWITSDDPQDMFRELSVCGCKDSPHVDHILPFSRAGNNSFDNARVVSEAHNSTKAAQYVRTGKEPAARRSDRNIKVSTVQDSLARSKQQQTANRLADSKNARAAMFDQNRLKAGGKESKDTVMKS
jgi:hypothetical protein